MEAPGPLIASGRDADIFDCGPGLVLRRSRRGRSLAAEARVMAYARDRGFPVPAVEEISDDESDLVMERVDGPDMVTVLRHRPWTVRRQGAVLARLHRELHAIPAPEWLPPAPVCAGPPGADPPESGPALVHMDLHPLNVILGRRGPVVIDWANAGRGDPAADLALTWVLMAAGEVPAGRATAAVMGRFRAGLVRGFVDGVDREQARRRLREVVAWKVQDANMSPAEQAAMWRLVDAEG